jgi:hypothetical protein
MIKVVLVADGIIYAGEVDGDSYDRISKWMRSHYYEGMIQTITLDGVMGQGDEAWRGEFLIKVTAISAMKVLEN